MRLRGRTPGIRRRQPRRSKQEFLLFRRYDLKVLPREEKPKHRIACHALVKTMQDPRDRFLSADLGNQYG